MKIITQFMLCVLVWGIALTAQAHNRPTITFNGQNYYLASFDNAITDSQSPMYVVEKYYPEGETSDTYTKSISKVIYLQVNDYAASARALIQDLKEDNHDLPFEINEIHEGSGKEPGVHKIVMNAAFWWPFRPTSIIKAVIVFQREPQVGHSMCYIYSEVQFNDPRKTKHDDLNKMGKSLLIDEKTANLVKDLSF